MKTLTPVIELVFGFFFLFVVVEAALESNAGPPPSFCFHSRLASSILPYRFPVEPSAALVRRCRRRTRGGIGEQALTLSSPFLTLTMRRRFPIRMALRQPCWLVACGCLTLSSCGPVKDDPEQDAT